MKNKLALLFILSLIFMTPVKADFYSGLDGADFTGEAYFDTSPATEQQSGTARGKKERTIPPLKQLRLKLQEKSRVKEQTNNQFAPTGVEPYRGEVEESEYASHEIVEDFEDMSPDGFEADEENINVKTKKSFWGKKNKTEKAEQDNDIILDCDNIDYDTEKYLIYARGNVIVEFIKQNTVVKADIITFDRVNNTVKAEGNVQILKNGQTITGDYIFVDLNEENALIENPFTQTATIEMKAKRGYVYGDRTVQEDGSIKVDSNYAIVFSSANNGPGLGNMMMPKRETPADDMGNGIVKLVAKDIKVTQKGDLETVSIKRGRLFKGGKKVFKVPAIKLYTNKNHDYGETNIWEIGAYRGLGFYTGPGVVFELPKGSVLKAMPILNYKSGFGIGGIGRFSSGTNQTMAGYGTAQSRFVVYGKQRLDDNLYMQYGVNGYMDEWFLGRRRPKYGISLVYDKGYSSDNFLIPNRGSLFRHRLEAGYFQDLDFDNGFERINGSSMGTPRFRYMAMANQDFVSLRDEEGLKSFSLGISSQFSSSIYGTGNTQVIGRIGPNMHIQYKRWMQDIGYYFSAYEDNSPMPVFDAYRYGKQNLYLREYFRICRWLTVSWFGSFVMSNDSPNNRNVQGNAFYISVGPDDLKFNLGYDFIRQTLRCTVDVMMDTKGTEVEYEKLEIKRDNKKTKTAEKKENTAPVNSNAAPTSPAVLQRAVVEDIKVMEEVL